MSASLDFLDRYKAIRARLRPVEAPKVFRGIQPAPPPRELSRDVIDVASEPEPQRLFTLEQEAQIAAWIAEHTPESAKATGPKRKADNIVADVGRKHGVAVAEIMGKKRCTRIVHARQEAMTTICEKLPWSVAEVGRYFHKDHTTVLHAIKVFASRNSAKPE